MRAQQKAAQVRLMGFDVDGVLTDGSLLFGPQGEELKVFHTLDGHGLKMLQEAGIVVAVISGRGSRGLELRAASLGIQYLYQNVHDKTAALGELLDKLQIPAEHAGYMGDDVVDLPILRRCGFTASPADGHPLVHRHVDYVSTRAGGRGAAREVCDFILGAQGKLDAMHAVYLG
ncbi:KdsC family phosphatase [Uliginosibacterium sp. H1]|uniref:KdsC family phosphatase n=1 Tax=Uliginosibacterium sp. H1 TaxID=3114757 RepID=UPI002E18D931|nr:HAD family hydrolase [Uliginosibacterium sp. H1]